VFKNDLVLRPNCLLTRRPLKFISSKRSLFFYKPYDRIIHFLYEHGYQVELIKNIKKLDPALLNYSHLFCDELTYENNMSLLQATQNSTINIISSKSSFLKDPPLYTIEVDDKFLINPSDQMKNFFLDHCIHLAEEDFCGLDLPENP
jgi:hypothetical protein